MQHIYEQSKSKEHLIALRSHRIGKKYARRVLKKSKEKKLIKIIKNIKIHIEI